MRIETDTVIAVFTNRGARLTSWRLKKYRNQLTGEPLELVENDLGETQTLPFSLRVDDAATTTALNSALYQVTTEDQAPGQPAVVQFEYANADGLRAQKTFTIEPGSYQVALASSVESGGAALTPAIAWGPGPGDRGATNRYHMPPEGIVFLDGGVKRYSASAVGKQPTYEGSYRFAGIDDHYFMAVALDPAAVSIAYQGVTIPPAPGSDESARNLMAFTIEPKQPTAAMTFFVGPKDFDVLAALDPEFTQAIRFGIFTVIVVPLLRSLVWVNGFVGNFGWSILVLTVIINVLMFPLRHKSVVSMRKMQEIQPEVKAIQERYAKLKTTDPAKQKMNQETDGAVPREGREPRERLRAHAPDDAGALRVLLAPELLHPASRRALHALDSRSLPAGSLLRDADRDGHQPALAAADDAVGRRRSRAAEDDDVHAGRVHGALPVGALRPGALLARPATSSPSARRTSRTGSSARPKCTTCGRPRSGA